MIQEQTMEIFMALSSILGEQIRADHLFTSKLIKSNINHNKYIPLSGIRDGSMEASGQCLAM